MDPVRAFYERNPFPGYPPRDSLSALRARAERSRFARLLDHSIPPGARVIEIGCGTGQMSLYLARADRVIVGVDIARAPLMLASAAARRFGVYDVRFIETDLRHPCFKDGTFDVVISSGVIHHTPEPRASFTRLVQLARPGGFIVVGVYNVFARLPTRVRRTIARATNYRFVPRDSVLRDRKTEPVRRTAWLRDQYHHPEEHTHSVAEVQRWFFDNDVEYLRTYPSTVYGDEPDDLFVRASDNWRLENWLAQLSWIAALGHEGGLFFTIGRRQGTQSSRPADVHLK